MRRPGTHQVQCAEFVPAGPTHRLAVDGNVLDVEFLGDSRDPTLEALMKGSRIDAVENPFKSIVRRNLGEIGEKATQPIEASFAEGFDLLPIFGPAQDGTQSNHDNVGKQMSLVAFDARVFEFAEVMLDGKWGSQGNSSMKGNVNSVPIVGVFT